MGHLKLKQVGLHVAYTMTFSIEETRDQQHPTGTRSFRQIPMMNYADYSYLLTLLSTVLKSFLAWAAANNFQLNPHKTRELIVLFIYFIEHNKHKNRTTCPPAQPWYWSLLPWSPSYTVPPGLPPCGSLE